MIVNKVYSRINWKNYPNASTALNETNLNRMDKAIDDLDNRVIEQDITKANQTTVNNMVKNWTMDETTGVITVEKQDGSKIMFDLNIEKIPVTFELSPSGILTMTTSDGTQFTANIGSMIPVLTFNESDQIAVSVSGSGVNKTYSFTIKDGSITESKLQPNYLADIKSESTKVATAAELAKEKSDLATESENNAKKYKESAESSAKLSQSYAIGETNSRENEDIDNSRYYSQQALNSSDSAKKSELAASTSESNAKSSETEAKKSEENAKLSEQSASNSSSSAAESESNALQSANNALVSETNSKKYYDQVKNISESLSGALRPMGTVLFSNLPSVSSVTDGDMYNISDEFVTTSDFVEGAGITEPAGSNVYKTSGGKWDVLAGSPVTGIKGSSESSYRRGNVDITPSNIGLGNVDNTADSEKSVKYATSAGSASSASKATGVVDYGATNKTIQIGYSGNGITGDEIKYIAGYTTGNNSDVNAKIKDVSKDALKSWLGLGSLAYSSATIPTIPSSLPANGGNSATVNGHTVNSNVPANAKFTDTWRGIQNNLTSTSTTDSLSAAQGKALNDKITALNSNLIKYTQLTTSVNGWIKLNDKVSIVYGSFPASSMVKDGNVGGYSAEIDLSKYNLNSYVLSIAAPVYQSGIPMVTTYWNSSTKKLKLICNVNVTNVYVHWLVVG